MPSLKAPLLLLLLPILSLAQTTAAPKSCPENWLEYSYNDNPKCCYGYMMAEKDDAFCCVTYIPTTLATASATSTSLVDFWSWDAHCDTKIPYTASDYSSRVSAASSKATSAADASLSGLVTSTPSSTTSESSASSAASPATSSDASSTVLETSSTDNLALPVATAENIVLGGAAAAAALFAL